MHSRASAKERSATVSSIDSDADLLLDLNRALRNPLMSLEIGPNRQRRIAEAERLLKSVAKQLAQRAGDSADDRRSREVIRVRVYNTLAPILLELRTAHDGTVALARRTLFASIAICLIGTGLVAALV
jgi:hypothetical protein